MLKTGILKSASSLATCRVQDADLCPALHKSLLFMDCIFLSKNTNLFKKKKNNNNTEDKKQVSASNNKSSSTER